MRCLYCHKESKKISFKSALLKSDELCINCRKKLVVERKMVSIEEIEVETFYEYDSFFKDLLIQYKECNDEALKRVFLYDISDYLNIRYFNYQVLFVPSSDKAIRQRGFNHLEGMFEELKLKRVKGLSMKRQLSQKGQNKTNRLAMIDNYVYKGEDIDRLLIVDDVLTTGSSILGVYRTMKNSSKKIKIVVLASQKRD